MSDSVLAALIAIGFSSLCYIGTALIIVSSLKTRLNAAESDVKELKKDMHDFRDEVRRELGEVRRENSDLKAQVAALISTVTALSTQMTTLAANSRESEREARTAKASL